ncbi:MAG TPA: hypothetical protein VMF07_07630 [Solirubrobacteraceae bacterium]|nr:hypothetical protein [Solirubrobacteraceae bacterium]
MSDGATAQPETALSLEGALPELAAVAWRPRVDEAALERIDRRWTRWTVGQEVPFLLIAGGLPWLSPVLGILSAAALGFAWFIPHLYANRGAGVVAPPRPWGAARGEAPAADAEERALGLLGDLVGHEARATLAETGFVLERGRFGVWLLGPAGALLVRGGGRRVQCYCVHATGEPLPRADRIAHLLLALRADESGFATVSNLSFSGARWRVRRCLDPRARSAFDAATAIAARS